MVMILRFILTFLFCMGAIETLRWIFLNRKDKEVQSNLKRWSPTIFFAVLLTLIFTGVIR